MTAAAAATGFSSFTLLEDDGLSPPPPAALAAARAAAATAAAAGAPSLLHALALPGGAALQFELTAGPKEVRLSVAVAGSHDLPYEQLTVAPPVAEGRRVVMEVGRVEGGEGEGAGALPRLERGSFELHDVLWP